MEASLRDRLINAKGIIRSLEEELQAADQGLIALSAELEDRARQLEENQARFQAMIENIGEAIALLDGMGTIAYLSAAFEQITGYSVEETTGTSAFAHAHPDDGGRIQAAWKQLVDRPGETDSLEARFRHMDGSWRTLEVTAKNLLKDAVVGGVVVTYRDVTRQRVLEQQFRQAQKMEAVGRLAGGVAHDFNNILTAIKGNADFLLEDLSEPERARGDINEIVRAANRARDLTSQLLAFSRQQVTEPRVLDPGTAIRNTEKMLRRLIGEDIALEVSIAPDLSRITADPTQMEQVLMNLAVNARDAMPTGGRLRIAAENATLTSEFARTFPYRVKPGPYVRISVSDTGEGMSEEVLKHVFDPFFTTKGAGKGSGLGLSTVYGIIKQAGGYVWVRSEVGEGTTFDFHLPPTDREPQPPARRAPPDLDVTGSETVLVVEDQDSVRVLAQRSLERVGYRLLQASEGAEALRICRAEGGKIDLLLTDVVMPGMGGKELAQQVRQLCGGARVLFMSGYSEEQIASRGLLEAGIHLLEKPFGVRDLQRKVRQVLDIDQYGDQEQPLTS